MEGELCLDATSQRPLPLAPSPPAGLSAPRLPSPLGRPDSFRCRRPREPRRAAAAQGGVVHSTKSRQPTWLH